MFKFYLYHFKLNKIGEESSTFMGKRLLTNSVQNNSINTIIKNHLLNSPFVLRINVLSQLKGVQLCLPELQ